MHQQVNEQNYQYTISNTIIIPSTWLSICFSKVHEQKSLFNSLFQLLNKENIRKLQIFAINTS